MFPTEVFSKTLSKMLTCELLHQKQESVKMQEYDI